MGLLSTEKDQAYDKIKEWLENEIGLLRGRDNSNYEIILFSDMERQTHVR